MLKPAERKALRLRLGEAITKTLPEEEQALDSEAEILLSRGISKPKATPQVCKSSRWVRAPIGGLVRLFKTDGSLVPQGEVLATVSDPFGEEERNIEAPFDGVIVGRAVMPVVNEGDAVFHLGRIGSVERAEGAMEDLALQLHDDPMFFEDEII